MMPLTFADKDRNHVITRIGGGSEVRQHLADMGFVAGGSVKIVSSINGNLIVSIKGVRVALSNEMAQKIFV